jgi:hypothetical protein
LVLNMMLGVMPARVLAMFARVAGMAGGSAGVVACLFMIAVLVVVGGFAMMMRRLIMMIGRVAMMFGAFMLKHFVSPDGCPVDAG